MHCSVRRACSVGLRHHEAWKSTRLTNHPIISAVPTIAFDAQHPCDRTTPAAPALKRAAPPRATVWNHPRTTWRHHRLRHASRVVVLRHRRVNNVTMDPLAIIGPPTTWNSERVDGRIWAPPHCTVTLLFRVFAGVVPARVPAIWILTTVGAAARTIALI